MGNIMKLTELKQKQLGDVNAPTPPSDAFVAMVQQARDNAEAMMNIKNSKPPISLDLPMSPSFTNQVIHQVENATKTENHRKSVLRWMKIAVVVAILLAIVNYDNISLVITPFMT